VPSEYSLDPILACEAKKKKRKRKKKQSSGCGTHTSASGLRMRSTRHLQQNNEDYRLGGHMRSSRAASALRRPRSPQEQLCRWGGLSHITPMWQARKRGRQSRGQRWREWTDDHGGGGRGRGPRTESRSAALAQAGVPSQIYGPNERFLCRMTQPRHNIGRIRRSGEQLRLR
jgi:hypothetical protein